MKKLIFPRILITCFVFIFGLTVFLASFSANAAEGGPEEYKQEELKHGFPCEDHCDYRECFVGGSGSICLEGVPCYDPSTNGPCCAN